jgi:hypothetical protein
MQEQNTCNTHGRPVKAGPTFDQLLSKYASKKVVLRNRTAKKPRTKRPNKIARRATQQASPIHPVIPGCSPLTYSSLIYCHVQMWNGTTMNPWYMHIVPLSIQARGHLHSIPVDPWSRPRKMQSETDYMH